MAVIVVTYHALAARASPVTVTPARLAADLRGLLEAGFEFVTIDACAAWLRGESSLPARAAAITFDDGYASAVHEGVPVLAAAGVPATLFVVAGRVGMDNQWPGQWRGIPRMELATAADLRALPRGLVTVGAHSWSHPDLPSLPAAALQREIHEAGDRIEQMTGAPVRCFAYPYGRFGDREVAVVADRYASAVSAHASLVTTGSSVIAIPRIDADDLRLALSAGLAPTRWMGPYLGVRRAVRALRQVVDAARRPSSPSPSHR